MTTQYATQTDLGLFGMPAAAQATFSSQQQDAALQAASAVVDSFIGQRFKLPLSTPYPMDVKLSTCRIAAFVLLSGRGFKPGTQDADSYGKGYQAAIELLKIIAEGKATPAGIIDSSAEEPGADETGQSAPYVVSVASVDQSADATRFDRFFGGDTPAPTGVVGPPRVRGWS